MNNLYKSKVEVRKNLALLQDWGNSITKMTTVELPKGTSIWVGRAAPQVGSNRVKLPGIPDVHRRKIRL